MNPDEIMSGKTVKVSSSTTGKYYYPDRWAVIKITGDDETLYKILAVWVGGFTKSDTWRLNSGIVKCVKNENEDDGEYGNYEFLGSTGSVYVCNPDEYGLTSLSGGVLEQLKARNPNIEILDSETKWETMTWDGE
jgi:hypothetical protein